MFNGWTLGLSASSHPTVLRLGQIISVSAHKSQRGIAFFQTKSLSGSEVGPVFRCCSCNSFAIWSCMRCSRLFLRQGYGWATVFSEILRFLKEPLIPSGLSPSAVNEQLSECVWCLFCCHTWEHMCQCMCSSAGGRSGWLGDAVSRWVVAGHD